MTVAQLQRLLSTLPSHMQLGTLSPLPEGQEYRELVDLLHVRIEHPERQPWEFVRLVLYGDPDSKVL